MLLHVGIFITFIVAVFAFDFWSPVNWFLAIRSDLMLGLQMIANNRLVGTFERAKRTMREIGIFTAPFKMELHTMLELGLVIAKLTFLLFTMSPINVNLQSVFKLFGMTTSWADEFSRRQRFLL